MIPIKLKLGHVFGTAGITVLVSLSSSFSEVWLTTSSDVPSKDIVNLIWSHPSHGIIHIFWSHSHCFVYVNTWSLIFTSPKCNQSFVRGSWTFTSKYHHLELSVQNIFISSQLVTYEGFNTEGEAKEIQIKALNIAERNKNNFLMQWINK